MIHFAAKIERNDPCWCGSGKKYKSCHMRFDEKIRGYQLGGYIVPDRSIIKTPEQIEGIKESAKVNMACLDAVAAAIHPGMSTEEIDKIVYETTVSMNAIPAPLHYEGFPKSVCTSINEEVCHGIPDEVHILKEGDIINVDCSTIYRGYFSDSSRMYCIGEVSEEKKRLVQVNSVDDPRRYGQQGPRARRKERLHGSQGDRRTRNRTGVPRGSFRQLCLQARRRDADGPRYGIHHRAHGQHGNGRDLPGRQERLDDLHG